MTPINHARMLSVVLVLLIDGSLAAGSLEEQQTASPPTAEEQARRKAQQLASGPDAVRPIDMLDTVWIEEQTWMETRDSVRGGKTTVIVSAGSMEQNGPYTANGKHTYVLRSTCEVIARKLGNALCAPIVPLEPGTPDAPGLRAGTIVITSTTFRSILIDVATSLKTTRFTDIVFIADSGGGVSGMKEVAAALNEQWRGTSARVHYIPEYYDEDRWSFEFLKTIGINQLPDRRSATRYDIHDDYHYEALVALTDPKLVRADQRIRAGRFSINGVKIGSVGKLLANGKKILEHRATLTANAIRRSVGEGRRK